MSVDFGMMARMIVDAFDNKKEPFAEKQRRKKRWLLYAVLIILCMFALSIYIYMYYQSRIGR